MKMNNILNLSVRKMLLTLGCVLVLGAITSFIIAYNQYTLSKNQIEKHLNLVLSYNQITPIQENEFMTSMSNMSQSFNFKLVNKNSIKSKHIICSRNNCYQLNFTRLVTHFFTPVVLLIILSIIFYIVLFYLQKRINQTIQNQIQIFEKIVNNDFDFETPIETAELKELISIIKKKTKNERYLQIIREIAHDMQVPIAGISAAIDRSHSNSTLLTGVLERLMSLNHKILKYDFSEKLTELNVSDLVTTALNEMKINYPNVNFIHNKELKDFTVKVKTTEVHRALINLVKNSIEANNSESIFIEINCFAKKEKYFIEVIDNGPGFSRQVLDNFENELVKTTKKNGQGLGLKQVKRAINESEGFISLSNTDRGAKVTISFLITKGLEQAKNDEVILIDDDPLIHLSWKMAAEKANIRIRTFDNVENFLESALSISLNTPIFIDSDLGNGVRGEVISKKIFDFGFQQISLATGFLAKDINKPFWIREVVGKRAPF